MGLDFALFFLGTAAAAFTAGGLVWLYEAAPAKVRAWMRRRL